MTTNHQPLFVAVFALICGLLFASSVTAQITGINAANSYSTNEFNDQNSFSGGSPGNHQITPIGTPWTGSANSLTHTDPITSDSVNAVIAANGSGSSYNISVTLDLSQQAGNTGHADLTFWFQVEYQLGSAGLPSQATLFPNFQVNGIVGLGGSSQASIQGNIWYYSFDGGAPTLLDTVTYSWLNALPGSFSATVTGTPNIGSTSALSSTDSLVVAGYITFDVDPATLSVETVPEPNILAVAGLGAASLFAFRRRLKV